MGDAAHGNLELHAVKVGVLAMLSVTYLGVTVCFVGIIFWESFFDSFRLWVSELSGWERLGGVEKVSVFWQKGEISTATLKVKLALVPLHSLCMRITSSRGRFLLDRSTHTNL